MAQRLIQSEETSLDLAAHEHVPADMTLMNHDLFQG